MVYVLRVNLATGYPMGKMLFTVCLQLYWLFWRHCEQIGEARSNEPVALYAGVGQFVAMVAGTRKHGQGMWVYGGRSEWSYV